MWWLSLPPSSGLNLLITIYTPPVTSLSSPTIILLLLTSCLAASSTSLRVDPPPTLTPSPVPYSQSSRSPSSPSLSPQGPGLWPAGLARIVNLWGCPLTKTSLPKVSVSEKNVIWGWQYMTQITLCCKHCITDTYRLSMIISKFIRGYKGAIWLFIRRAWYLSYTWLLMYSQEKSSRPYICLQIDCFLVLIKCVSQISKQCVHLSTFGKYLGRIYYTAFTESKLVIIIVGNIPVMIFAFCQIVTGDCHNFYFWSDPYWRGLEPSYVLRHQLQGGQVDSYSHLKRNQTQTVSTTGWLATYPIVLWWQTEYGIQE